MLVQEDYTLVALYKIIKKNWIIEILMEKVSWWEVPEKRKLKEKSLIYYLEVIIRTEAPFEAREYAKWKSKLVFPLCSGP